MEDKLYFTLENIRKSILRDRVRAWTKGCIAYALIVLAEIILFFFGIFNTRIAELLGAATIIFSSVSFGYRYRELRYYKMQLSMCKNEEGDKHE